MYSDKKSAISPSQRNNNDLTSISEFKRHRRADECGHQSSRKTEGNKRQIVKTRRKVNGYTGSRKGNPDSSLRRHDQQQRPSSNLETDARSGDSVRNDRSNKFRSPGTNAPPATRASELPLPNDETREHAGCYAKGQINGREFGKRRTPLAAGSRLRHEDVQNIPMIGDKTQKISRRKGLRTGNAGSDRTREGTSLTYRSTAAMSTRTKLQELKPAQQPRPAPVPPS